MVNDSFGHGRVRVAGPSTRVPRIVPNPAAASLALGTVVVPHYDDPAARARHSPGVIIELANGQARVRWQTGGPATWWPLSSLVKQ
ncbi:hypothetical protein [Paractinoplanes durhamensis]|uniref:Uncharacterized protein n=1 Tax=Paractinoplanes durhamensis TaxID=113563 RepID=A0ABQ3YZR8_9ACTN|nr:hypothetical protein [Actinoplanes durhamensis]GIE03086.1 hypothetical protein Adu01nite_44360 [Actinoplanes durhamensis]